MSEAPPPWISDKRSSIQPVEVSVAANLKYRGQSLRRLPPVSSATETEDNEEPDETETETDFNAKHVELSNPARRQRSSAYHGHVLFPQLEAEKPLEQRMGAFRTRTIWTLVLIISFLIILAAGHFYVSLLVLVLSCLVYREVIALKRNIEKDEKLPLFFVLRWYWFALTVYGTGYTWLLPLVDGFGFSRSRPLKILVSHHLIITYLAGMGGLILFIMSLRRFSLRYQFSQFALLLLTCLFVVGQSMFQIINVYDGLIWFFISCSSVIVNDISSYIFGFFFGRTRLLKLSPKKTVEGFLGGSVITIVWSVAIALILSNFQVFICPQTQIEFKPFAMWTELHCKPHQAFILKEYQLPGIILNGIDMKTFMLKPAWIHCFVLGVFAAFFAPFGGFFASALKRALRIKDFGDSIPGHGGITDRFDCQLVMGMFTFLYVRTSVSMCIGITRCS